MKDPKAKENLLRLKIKANCPDSLLGSGRAVEQLVLTIIGRFTSDETKDLMNRVGCDILYYNLIDFLLDPK